MSLLGCDLAGALVPLLMMLALLIGLGTLAHLKRAPDGARVELR